MSPATDPLSPAADEREQAAEVEVMAWLLSERARGTWLTIDSWIVEAWIQPGGLLLTPADLAARLGVPVATVHAGLGRLVVLVVGRFGTPEAQAALDLRTCRCAEGLTDPDTCPAAPRLYVGQYL